ncbi:MAG: RDD family protein, partial [Terracidiphilus sp.]
GGLGIAGHMLHPPAMKTAEMSAGFALLLVVVFYHAFFLLTAMATPGMMYARIALCTFDDEQPTRLQVRDRLGAMLVSLLPVGLGMAWSIFDEDRLSWHDRLSRTYQRRC